RRGKLLRYQPDGAIPANNPISNNPMLARGLRNPRGVAFNPGTAECFGTDSGNPATNGPDELNVMLPEGNYGWSTAGASGDQANPDFQNPAWVLQNTFEPSGVAFHPVTGASFPTVGYRDGVAYVGSEAASGAVLRVVLTGSNQRTGVAAWTLASSFPSAVRDLRFGPDGNLYVLTDGVLYRVRYTGNTSPSAPQANAGPDQEVNEGQAV